MIKNVPPILLCGMIAGLLVWAGGIQLFHRFMLYDDEGYVLISLKNFSLHGSLYDQVYSQYGPAFYLIYDALHRLLGFAWTNTSGRWITLFNWTGTVVFCSLLVRRAGGSWPLVLCVLAEGFYFLWIMASEPMHPGSTITLIVSATAWLGWEMLRAGRINAFAVITAAMGAALALIKINVGVFLGLSTIFWLVLSMPGERSRRRDVALIILGCVLPLALMRTRIHEMWAQIFAVVSVLSISGAVLAAGPAARLQPAGLRAWSWFASTGLAVTALTTCLMLPRGTSVAQLLQGVVVGPLRHPGAYAFGPGWLPGAVGLAVAMVVLLACARRRPDDRRLLLVIAWLRIAAAMVYVYYSAGPMDGRQGIQGLCYGVPLAGLFAWPLDAKDPARAPADQARAWLSLLLDFQCLHAYPVAGSQLNWGTFLWLPLMALGFEDALRTVSKTFAPAVATGTRAAAALSLSLLAAHFTMSFVVVSLSLLASNGDEPLAQPGAQQISIPARYSSSMRILSENARFHGDMLFSLPGAYSFNLWTGVETPTFANVTHWFSLLDDEQQQAIIQRLDKSDRPILIVQHTVLADVVQSGVHPKGPLMDYLLSSFHRSFAIESYSFLVRNGRSIAPLSTGTLNPSPENNPNQFQLELTMAPKAGNISQVRLFSAEDTNAQLVSLDPSQTEVTLTPLHLDGTTAGAPQPASWPWSIDQLSLVTLAFTAPSPLPPANSIEAILLDAEGNHVASARVLPADGFARPSADPQSP